MEKRSCGAVFDNFGGSEVTRRDITFLDVFAVVAFSGFALLPTIAKYVGYYL
jgi:hypothetical protein